MSFYMLYIGKNITFESTILKVAMSSFPNSKMMPASHDCEWCFEIRDHAQIVVARLQPDHETIVLDGFGTLALDVAIAIQKVTTHPVHIIDDGYSFDLIIRNHPDSDNLGMAIAATEDES